MSPHHGARRNSTRGHQRQPTQPLTRSAKPTHTRSQEHSPGKPPRAARHRPGAGTGEPRLEVGQHAPPARAPAPSPSTAPHASADVPTLPALPPPAGPPDLAEPRPSCHHIRERDPPREAHRAATRPSLPRCHASAPLTSTKLRRTPSTYANYLRVGWRWSPAATGTGGLCPTARSGGGEGGKGGGEA